MAKTNGAQTIQTIEGRQIILSTGVGKTNAEELIWLTDNVLKDASAWKNSGWAYIADCSKMKPVGPDEIGYLVNMTKAFVEAGCKAFGFAEGQSVMLKIQAKKNTQMSETGVLEGHFETVEQALDWIKEAVNL